MSGTVGQNQVSAFTSPSNGDALDATTVKANDNANRTALNTHDADATIHVQSSVLASRPAAATAGRLWLTSDGLRMYYDTGSAWSELGYLPLVGGTLTGALHITSGGAVISGTLEASTLVSDGTLTVAGTATFSAGITVGNSGITSSGELVVSGGGVDVTGNSLFRNNLTVNGAFAAGGATTLQAVTLQAALAHTGTTAGFFGTAARGKPSLTYPTTYTLSNFEQSVLILLSEIGLVSYTQSGTNWVVS